MNLKAIHDVFCPKRSGGKKYTVYFARFMRKQGDTRCILRKIGGIGVIHFVFCENQQKAGEYKMYRNRLS